MLNSPASPIVADKDNAFIGICGLAEVEYGDVVAAGRKFLQDGPAEKTGYNSELFDFSYENPCDKFDNENCLDQILTDASTIEDKFNKNSFLLARYREVRGMPVFVNNSTSSDYSSRFTVMRGLSKLVWAKALLDIKRDGQSDGWEAIEEEINFTKKIYYSNQLDMIDLMIVLASVANNLHALKAIIYDDGIDISGHEDRLRTMLEFKRDTPAVADALRRSKVSMIQLIYQNGDRLFGQDASVLMTLVYKRNATCNSMATYFDQQIHLTEAAPLLNFPAYYKEMVVKSNEGFELSYGYGPRIKKLYDRYGLFFFKNWMGEIVSEASIPMFSSYLTRGQDEIVYSRLLRARLELRLMADRPDDLSEALGRLGPETYNPYTGAPFNWDKEKSILWAERAVTAGGGRPNTAQNVILVEAPAPGQAF